MNAILLIDDDLELCRLLDEYLRGEGFTVTAAHDGESGLRQALAGHADLIILDVMLPGRSGFEVLRAIRRTSSIPVLMLTARGEEIDRIVGLEMGADDYLAKPFNPRELVARIRAVQRRLNPAELPAPADPALETLVVEDLSLDPGSLELRQNGRLIAVTSVEFALLHNLLRHIGRVVSREDLATSALGRPLSLFDRSIDVHVSSLRKKLGRTASGQERIKAVRGVGYMYATSHKGVVFSVLP